MKVTIKTPFRTGFVESVEHPDQIVLNFELSVYADLPDNELIAAAVAEVVYSHYGDPRPFVIRDAATGKLMVVSGTEDEAIVHVADTN